MTGLAAENDFTSQISDKLGSPMTDGSFGNVYRCTIQSNKGKTEAAVKVFKFNPGQDTKKIQKGIGQELKVWLRLKRPTIVPLLGIAYVEGPFPALVSQWMPSGTLETYVQKKSTITASARVVLARGVADGLNYLHSENVVHGDLHPGNVLIDGLGKPCLTDFGLTTVLESTVTDEIVFDLRYCAPEVIGTEFIAGPEKPNFKSDVFSFGGVMFLIFSGKIPWKEKVAYQICKERSRRRSPARPHNILDNQWNLITRCWSWNPEDRPDSAEVFITTKCFIIPRNVVVYGKGGAGKSSLINLIAGRDVAETDPGSFLHTKIPAPFELTIGEECFRLWDTGGFDECECSKGVPAAVVEKNLTTFLRSLDHEDGVHLFIYCMRGTQAIRALKTHYEVFSSVARENNVPTTVIVTGLKDYRPVMAKWWDRNKDQLTKYGIHPSPHTCITTLKDYPAKSPDIRQRLAQSYEDVCQLISHHCL